ncbi:MAG TPA: TonB-dependent receptor [Cyclobacteriaceae bacterium]
MSLKTMFLLSTSLFCMQVIAQDTCTGVLTGKVLDDSQQPLIGATILLLPLQKGEISDALGSFSFTGLCPGTYLMKVQYLGYEHAEFQLEINGKVTFDIHLKEISAELEGVVILDHHDALHTENAINFIELDERKLSELAGKSLGETLKEVTGVNSIQTGPGIFKPVIHGVHSDRVLILNHGLRQEGQQWGAEHAPEIDPFIASNIVVIKDASAIKYGTNALGGVIVINPSELPNRPLLSGTVHTILQSNGRSGAFSSMLEGGIKNMDGWGWRVQGTARRSGDYNTPDYVLTNTGVKELNFSAATGYHKEKIGFDVFFSHFQTQIGILKGTAIGSPEDLATAMESPIPQYTTDFSYKIGEPRQEVSHNLLKINGHIQTTHGDWRIQYGFQNNNRKEYDIRIGQLSQIPSINLKLNSHSLDLEWETLHSERGTVILGLNNILQNNYNISGTQRIPFIPNFTNLSTGVFGVAKLLLKTWTMDFGLRYDYRYYDVTGYDFKNSLYSTTYNFHNISATLGTKVSLAKDHVILLNLSSAWRPPHVAELLSIGRHQSAAAIEYGLLLQDTTNEVRSIGDVNFNTEQSVKFVATYQWNLQSFSLEASPYANYIFNYIFLRPYGVTKSISGTYPFFRYTQTDALFLGIDLSGSWRPVANFQVIPKASLLRASDEQNNNPLVFIPSNKYDLTFRYEKPAFLFIKSFYIESKSIYVARQTRAPRVISPREIVEAQVEGVDLFKDNTSIFDFQAAPKGYFLWNISIGASIRRSHVQYNLRISSENTLNQKYREYTNRLRYYADDIGRNITLSLKCIF